MIPEDNLTQTTAPQTLNHGGGKIPDEDELQDAPTNAPLGGATGTSLIQSGSQVPVAMVSAVMNVSPQLVARFVYEETLTRPIPPPWTLLRPPQFN